VFIRAGAKRLVPAPWRKWPLFDNIFRLSGVPVITVQLRYDGWITELQDPDKMRNLSKVKQAASLPAVA
jgi:zeta-carotene desaturase